MQFCLHSFFYKKNVLYYGRLGFFARKTCEKPIDGRKQECLNMKRRNALMAVWSLLLVLVLSACGLRGDGGAGQEEPDRKNGRDQRLNVVTTLFPYYDFTRQIAGDRVKLTMVVPAGMDSHSFEPTPADMRTIQHADILICNGGAMEHWLSEVLETVDTSRMTVVTMMDYVEAVEEEIVEGMEDEDHDHDHDHGEHGEEVHGDHDHTKEYIDYDGHETEIEYDEHIWTSPVNAMRITGVIRDVLQAADPERAAEYDRAAAGYLEQLRQIDEGFLEVSEHRRRSMIVVGDKFPFRYLADTYHLDYRAAFSGCSTDTEPSAKTIAYLIDKVRQEQIPAVYYLELSSRRVSEIIGEETGAQPLLLHSCHNVTRAEFESGITYVELMRQNVENLRKGLDE